MKVAFISDVHGNAIALDAVLNEISKNKVDQIVVLGDLVFRGPEPKRTLDTLRSLNAVILKGNTDEWIVRGIYPHEVSVNDLEMMQLEREWCKNKLTQEDINYISNLSLDEKVVLSKNILIHAFHATPTDLFELLPPETKDEVFQQKIMQDEKSNIYVYAHTHHPLVRHISGKCVVNPGAVGYTFDGLTQSSYAVIETNGDHYRVTIERVSYPIELVVQAYYINGYPNSKQMVQVVQEAIHPSLVSV